LSAGYYDAYYLKAQKVRTLIKEDFEKAFAQVDVLVSPTAPTTAFKAGEKFDDPLSMYLSDLMTIPVNLAGLPALSLPCGFDVRGLPVGIQLIGNVLQESRLFGGGGEWLMPTNSLQIGTYAARNCINFLKFRRNAPAGVSNR
jgi:aspartyl/glutamyl-tRNA(Asn/Gln) amidotransferase subunit A (EC 6.3.5.-)